MSAATRPCRGRTRLPLLATLWPVLAALPAADAFKDGLHHEEAKSYDFFGKTTPHGEPHPVPRYKTLTAAEFERLALDGRPFVLEDGGRGQPFVGWSCSRFKEEFPKAVVKIEYVKGDKPIRSMSDDWESELHPIKDADPDGPQFAPWYWGVKGADDKEDRATVYQGPSKNNPFPAVQQLMRIPDYMRNTSDNRREIFGSPEFWFSAPKAGAQMHMDGHCESTMVIQLSGKRIWKLGWTPAVPNNTVYKEGSFADGEIYGKGYHPPLEAVVSEGEALFFPSGFLHSTMNIGDTCAASLTFQFRDPIPGRYFRHAMSHLRRTGDFSECWKLLGQAARKEDDDEVEVEDDNDEPKEKTKRKGNSKSKAKSKDVVITVPSMELQSEPLPFTSGSDYLEVRPRVVFLRPSPVALADVREQAAARGLTEVMLEMTRGLCEHEVEAKAKKSAKKGTPDGECNDEVGDDSVSMDKLRKTMGKHILK